MMHTNYQPARKGLYESQIHAEKELRTRKNLGRPGQAGELLGVTLAGFQRKRLRYSDRGDFTRCYRGGF
ncbi:hypothetical protein [Pseudomonas phage PlaquesPlease]|uniref:Uncharacterized protein n=1 Tax=Pseudomonas phage PlaquesPlease TaxID=2762289 RepID=A0A7G8LJS1_9CAUD|nr:hypothetical protein [Pseudomonas phage PlaquesPlease]